MKIGDSIVFIKNELEENLIGKTGTIIQIYSIDLVQVSLSNEKRIVLAKRTEFEITDKGK